MLSFKQRLPFPDLIYCGRFTVPEKHKPGEDSQSRTVPIFRLDWKDHDFETKPKGRIDLLPPHWATWLDACRFSIDGVYQSEVTRHCRSALLDWQLDAPFDHRVGEILQQPAVAHVETAFRLLADCLWDEDRMDWQRGHPRLVFLSAALLRFWDGKIPEVRCARLEDLRTLGRHPGSLVKTHRGGEWATGSAIEDALVQSFLHEVDERFEKADLVRQRVALLDKAKAENPAVTTEELEALLREEGPGAGARAG